MKNIYIVLSQTGTIFSRLVHHYTKDPYNHASLSFVPDLSVMYSFGRKTRYNMLNAGFIKESIGKGIFAFFPLAVCCVLELSVTEDEFEKMNEVVNYFCENENIFTYNILGVMAYAFGISLKTKKSYFCSQFVSHVLREAGLWNELPEFTKPVDLLKIPNIKMIFKGYMTEFGQPAVIHNNEHNENHQYLHSTLDTKF